MRDAPGAEVRLGAWGESARGRGRCVSEIEKMIEEALKNADGPVTVKDFDFQAKRFLMELKNKDKQENTNKCQEALEMVKAFTATKERSAVRNWVAYIFTLLRKFEPGLHEVC